MRVFQIIVFPNSQSCFFFLVLFCTLISEPLLQPSLNFRHYSINEGLSQTTINEILQDKRGFIWIRTEDGLNRFDGHTFKVYRNIKDDSTSLITSWGNSMLFDDDGKLWILARFDGLNIYKPETDAFERVYFPIKTTNRLMTKGEDGNIYVTTDKGLFKVNTKSKKTELISDKDKSFIRVYPFRQNIYAASERELFVYDSHTGVLRKLTDLSLLPDISQEEFIYEITLINEEIFFLSTNKSLYEFNLKTKKTKEIKGFYTKNRGFIKAFPYIFFFDLGEDIWMSSMNSGIFRINKEDPDEAYYFDKEGSISYRLNSSDVTSVSKDSEERTWINTKIGFNLFLNNQFYPYYPILQGDNQTKDSYFYRFLSDKKKNIFFGSSLNGLVVLPNKKKFRDITWFYSELSAKINLSRETYNKNIEELKSFLMETKVRDLVEDKDGNLWIGTENGLLRINQQTGFIKIYKNHLNAKPGEHEFGIGDVIVDYDNDVWIAITGGDLCKYDRARDGFIRYYNTESPIHNKMHCYTLFPDKSGEIWIGYSDLIYVFNKKLGKYYLPEGIETEKVTATRAFYEDDNGNIWIGNAFGIFKIDKNLNKNHFYPPKDSEGRKIEVVDIMTIKKDGKYFWIGTYGHGFYRFEPDKNEFKVYDSKHGLKSDYIIEIEKDKDGYFWISTYSGICRFDPEKEVFFHFDKGENIKSREFNSGASLYTSTGWMIFGGTEGTAFFKPEEIQLNRNPVPVYLTEFKKFNKTVILNPSIGVTDKLILNYTDYFFSFVFSSIEFAYPEQINYAYKMEGFDKDWVYTGNKTEAFYTNLDPGEYTFRVIAANEDGFWNMDGVKLTVIIIPPYWVTWWFRTIIVVVVVIFFAVLYLRRIRHLKSIETMRYRIAQNIHDEFGSKITTLGLWTRALLRNEKIEGDPISKESLEKILNETETINKDLRDIIWSIDPQNDEWKTFVATFRRFASDFLSAKGIVFNFSVGGDVPDGMMHPDQRHNFWFSLKEICNNIVKHSGAKEVNVSLLFEKAGVNTIIEDNGTGFDTDKIEKGNGLENIKNRILKIKGKAELITSKGKGTKWKIVFPI